MAALLVLGLGYGIGRVSAPTITPAAMRAAIEPELRAALVSELRQQVEQDIRGDWLAAAGQNEEALSTPFRRQMRERLDEWKAQAVTPARRKRVGWCWGWPSSSGAINSKTSKRFSRYSSKRSESARPNIYDCAAMSRLSPLWRTIN